jgi:hypothetical protein
MSEADAPRLIWPSALTLPTTGRPLVYLDLNHWISLAKAAVGHAQGGSLVGTLDACRSAVRMGAATFVLGSAHYSELLKIESRRQRHDVGGVMEELSQFKTLLSRASIMKLELSAALDYVLGLESRDAECPLVGYGVMHAFGLPAGHFRIKDRSSGEDVTEVVRQQYGPERFDAYMAEALIGLERGALRGPKDDEELGKLRGLGYDPQRALQVARNRADEEAAQRLRLDGDGPWRRHRLQDVVAARELLIEFQRMAPLALNLRGISLERILTSPEEGVAFMRSMPSIDVTIELKTAWHRNRDKPWSANDIYDVDALALAIPYCDIVVTEKACHHALIAAGMDRRMHTVVLRDLTALPAGLLEWQAA